METGDFDDLGSDTAQQLPVFSEDLVQAADVEVGMPGNDFLPSQGEPQQEVVAGDVSPLELRPLLQQQLIQAALEDLSRTRVRVRRDSWPDNP